MTSKYLRRILQAPSPNQSPSNPDKAEAPPAFLVDRRMRGGGSYSFPVADGIMLAVGLLRVPCSSFFEAWDRGFVVSIFATERKRELH